MFRLALHEEARKIGRLLYFYRGDRRVKEEIMKIQTTLLSVAVGLCVQAQGAITVGTVIGIDFESPSPVFGTAGVGTNPVTNFNTFDVQAADGATVSLGIGSLIDTANNSLPTVGLDVTNNLGKESGLTGAFSGATMVTPFNETSIYSDSYGAANVVSSNRADSGTLAADANIVITFTGLDTSFLYDLTGGGVFGSNNPNNFNTVWTSGTVQATTDSDSSSGGEFVTLSDLAPDSSGELSVTVTRANVQLLFSAVTLEAVSQVPEPSTSLLVSLAGFGLLVRRRR